MCKLPGTQKVSGEIEPVDMEGKREFAQEAAKFLRTYLKVYN